MTITAADLLRSGHPLHQSFTKWLDGREPTKRKAREYLALPKVRLCLRKVA